MEMLLFLVLLVEFIFFILYGIFVLYDIFKRKEKALSVDLKMLNMGRIISWGGILGIVIVSRNMRNNFYLLFVLLNIFQAFYYFGLRLTALCFRLSEENKETFYYEWDRWLERIYREYFERLWKDKE